MVREIEAGNVSTVIVKDMSRFGRNYLQVGFYTEIMFSDKGVRFIAVNNSIDSARPQENDFTPFLNIMNEFYSRDTSNKIKAIFRARMQDGKRCSGSVPYGYVRSPSDKQTLVVDPEAAQVVRQIFDLACQGMGPAKIADFLCEAQVLIPSAYQRLNHPEYCRNDYRNPYRWSGNTVNTILSRREYLGETILGKSVCENFKTKKRRAATPEEQLVFPNTHEAIIDQETWDTAQQMRKRAPRRRPNGSDSHRLSGLVYCADCGARLSYHDCTASRCRDTAYDSDLGFQCSHYGNLHHSFIGTFVLPGVEEEEEAKRAEQEQQRAERRRTTQQRSAQRRKERLREAAKTDAAAAAKYEAYRVQHRAYGKNYRERRRARKGAAICTSSNSDDMGDCISGT